MRSTRSTPANAAGTAVQIQMAVTNKILDTTTALQQDMISQLFARCGHRQKPRRDGLRLPHPKSGVP